MTAVWRAAGLATLLAILVTSASIVSRPDSAVAKPGCLKIVHKKRVAKVVTRNGKKETVYVWKKWSTCDPYEAPGPPRLNIQASEYKFTLSRPVIKSGNLVLEYDNRGEDAHNLRIAKKGSGRISGALSDVESRDLRTRRFQLKPGRYRLWCALRNHARLGMRATLKVVR